MRALTLALAAIVTACYQPSPPEGLPCSATGECPSPLICDLGACVRMPRDASGAVDAFKQDGSVVDVAIDVPIDAAQPIMTFGAGSHVYTVPTGCAQILVKAWGAGGGGGGDGVAATNATDGGDSAFFPLHAAGGKGAPNGNPGSTYLGGAGGVASGGTTNVNGFPGGNGNSASAAGTTGAGGSSPNGGAGGPPISTVSTSGMPGSPPGGGGSGGQGMISPAPGGGGGGYAESVLIVSPAQAFTLTVGAGGPGGMGGGPGGAGADGLITVQCQ